MKKFLSHTFLILAFCFSAFGQAIDNAPCPTISVNGPTDVIMPGGIADFSAKISGDFPQLIYKWSVSNGSILEGQGTPFIRVDTTGLNNINIEARVEITGLPQSCRNTASAAVASVVGCGLPMILDEYGKIPFKDERARVEQVALALQQDKTATAIFVIYFGRKDSIKSLQTRLFNISKYLTETRKISKDRLKLVWGGEEPSTRTRIYVSPAGATEPVENAQNWDEAIRRLTKNN